MYFKINILRITIATYIYTHTSSKSQVLVYAKEAYLHVFHPMNSEVDLLLYHHLLVELQGLAYVQYRRCNGLICIHMYRFFPNVNQLSSNTLYSGLTFTRFGRSVDCSFFMSLAVTLQDSKVSDIKFLSGFRCCRPELVTREFETFKETSWVNPAIIRENSLVH